MAQTAQPSHRAFTVIKREGQDDFWLPIGAAFPHQSGGGFNVILQALPIPGADGQCKIVLRPPRDEEATERPPKDTARRDDNRGRRRDR